MYNHLDGQVYDIERKDIMKKTFSLILAAALVLTLTACNKSDGSSSDTVSGETSQTVSSAESSDVLSAPESTIDDNSIVVPDDPDNPADPDDPGNGGVDNSGLEFPDNRAGRMVKAALAEGEWGALIVVESESIGSVTGVSVEDLDEFCCVMPMMSAVPNEVYCMKPKDGKAATVRTALSNLIDAKKEDHMLYPSVQEAWANAVLEEDGGYVYLVVHPDNAQTIADIMGAAK